jgi:hypothetical protein
MLFCRAILLRCLLGPGSRHLITRQHFNHVRASVWLDTLPKTAKLCFPSMVMKDHRMDNFVEIINPPCGSQIWFGGLDEKERVEKVLGQEYATILVNEVSQTPYSSIVIVRTRLAQKVRLVKGGGYLPLRGYYDLNPTRRRHWSHVEFIEKRNPVSGRKLLHPDQFAAMQLNPVDNSQNLPAETLQEYRMLPEKQYKRFYLGDYSAELDGALWTFESLEHARCLPDEVPLEIRRIIISVDPSGTTGEEETRSDEVGIVVAARGDDGIGYLLADLTCQLPPEGWGRRVVEAYSRYGADAIVAEGNFGGDMVRAVIDAAARGMGKALPPVQLVSAFKAKHIRAEPISVLYGFERNGVWEQDRIRHAGEFLKLEEELLNFSSAGYMGPKSPNRADALIWAFSDLMLGEPAAPGWARSRLELVS